MSVFFCLFSFCVCVCLSVCLCICADASLFKVTLQKAISNFHDHYIGIKRSRACSTGVVQTSPVGKADSERRNTRKKERKSLWKEHKKERSGLSFSEPVWPSGKALGWRTSVRIRFGSPFSSKVVVVDTVL